MKYITLLTLFVIGLSYSEFIAFVQQCSTIDSLITPFVPANDTILVQSIWMGYQLNRTVYYCGIYWGPTQWLLFKGAYLPKITTTITNTSLNITQKHEMIFTVIEIFLQSYANKTFFWCTPIGYWGFFGDYLSCFDGASRSCACNRITTLATSTTAVTSPTTPTPTCVHVDPTPSGYIGALMDANISQSYPIIIQNNPPMFTNPSTGISTTNASYAYWRPTSSTSPLSLYDGTYDAAFNFYQSPSCSPCFCVTNQNCYQPYSSDYSAYMIPYCDTNGNCEMLAATAAAIGPYTPFVDSAGQPMPENFYDNYTTGVYLQVVGFGCNGCGALQSKLAQLCPAASTTPMPTTTTPLAIN